MHHSRERHFWRLSTPTTWKSPVGAMQQMFETEQASGTDVRIVLPDNEVRWIRMRARRNPAVRGPKQVSGIFVDVTDQKLAEAEAALQRQEIAHLMRVSVLGELSGSIAHEINQPLTAILSNAQAALRLLGQKSPDLEEVRDALQDIVQEDNRAGEVVHRLRHLLKKGEPKLESVNINDLVRSTAALLQQRTDRPRNQPQARPGEQAVSDDRAILFNCSKFCLILS